jgi:hypothetical protein
MNNPNGFHGPFAYRAVDGIHIGDDNHKIFSTIQEALDHAKRARLSGGALSKSRAHHRADARDNYAEYHWHVDAGIQIDLLSSVK